MKREFFGAYSNLVEAIVLVAKRGGNWVTPTEYDPFITKKAFSSISDSYPTTTLAQTSKFIIPETLAIQEPETTYPIETTERLVIPGNWRCETYLININFYEF